MSPILVGRQKPPAPKVKGVSYRGPPGLVDEIDDAAADLNISRNEAITQLLTFALAAHRKDAGKKPKK